MKFCPNCGATDKDFYKGFCTECYVKMNEFAEAPERLKIARCKKCGFLFYKNGWVQGSHNNLAKTVSDKVKVFLFEPKFEAELKEKTVSLRISGFADERQTIPVTVAKEIKIDFEDKTCDSCQRYNSQNHEVKIQVRRLPAFDALKYASLIRFIKKRANFMMRKDEKARAFWTEEKREGTDFLFGFREMGEEALHEVLDNFKVKHEMSNEFLGIDKSGKRKIRVTYCLRI
jgi:NMD protein affecting ribosome stability and mRNA decay